MQTIKRPNILFVFADQLRGSSLGHISQEPVITPNLDQFAQQGIRFSRAVSNAPLCCPMRASIVTGLHPLSHGVVGNDIALREDVPSVAKSLAAAGYYTGYIGKWHLDGQDRSCFTPPGPRRQGFEYWAASNCNHNYMASYYYRDEPEPIWQEGYEPTLQTDLAIEFLRDAGKREQPFCLFMSWGPPHCPYEQVPDEFMSLYNTGSLQMRENAVNPDPKTVAGYYAHISALDWNFGRLLQALDDLGLRDDTLVIFTSDHGDMLYSHDRGWKCKPWQESVIVPFIARWPGTIPEGSVETASFGLVNVMPTLLSVCGVDIPGEVEGDALPHMLLHRSGERPKSTPIYFHMRATKPAPEVWRGVVTKTHTYARFKDEPWVLYDDAADPYQMHNLAHEPSSAGTRALMEDELQVWLGRMHDSFETHLELAERYGVDLNDQHLPICYNQPHMADEMMRRITEWKSKHMQEK